MKIRGAVAVLEAIIWALVLFGLGLVVGVVAMSL